MNIKELPIDIMAKIAEDLDTETLSIGAFSFYEHRHGPFSTQLLSRIERLRAFCSLLRDTCWWSEDDSLFIDPSHILPYHADKAYWNEPDFRLVAKIFMENKLFPVHVIVYVSAMWGYTDYAEKLIADDKRLTEFGSPYPSGRLKRTMYHGAGMGGYIAFKKQEIENDLGTLERYSVQQEARIPPELNCSWVIAYMHGLVCRGYALSREGRERVDALLSRYNTTRSSQPSWYREKPMRILFSAALLSGDTQYIDELSLSIGGEKTVMRLKLMAALQLGRQQEALGLLEALLENNQNRFWELGGFASCVLKCAVRQRLDVFVQACLDRDIGHRMKSPIKDILRKGAEDFIACLRLGNTADAEKDLRRECSMMVQDKAFSGHPACPAFERYVMRLDARRGLQLRYGPDADIDAMYEKADRLAYARIMQQRPRRSEKRSDKKSLAATVLCAGLVLAVSAVCAAANTSGMQWSK